MTAMRLFTRAIAAFCCLSLGAAAAAEEFSVPSAVAMSLEEKYAELERENGELAEKLLLLEIANRDLRTGEKEARKKLADLDAAAKRFSRNLLKRTFRNVSRHVAGMAGSAIPYVGAGVQVGMTKLDVRDGCETLEELNELMRAMGQETVDAARVCEIKVPPPEEVLAQVIGNWRTAYAVAAAWANQYETRLPPQPPTVPYAGANELWIAVFGANPALPPSQLPGLTAPTPPRLPLAPVPPLAPVLPTLSRP